MEVETTPFYRPHEYHSLVQSRVMRARGEAAVFYSL